MNNKILKLKIITPTGLFLEKEIYSVNVKTTEGYIGILVNHSPIVANIVVSQLTYRDINKKLHQLLISGGLLSILDGINCTILSEKVEEETVFHARLKAKEEQRKERGMN